MRFRLKAGTGIPGRGPSMEEGEPETLKKLRLQDESLPFLFRSSFCGRIRLPETRLYPKIDRGHCDSGGIRTRISSAAPSRKVS